MGTETTFEDAVGDWNDAATSAFHRVLEETGKSRTQVAADMGMSASALDSFMMKSGRWSLGGVLRLAMATGQNPVRMLGREVIS